jgi:LCP family protein required for cell wall assembly
MTPPTHALRDRRTRTPGRGPRHRLDRPSLVGRPLTVFARVVVGLAAALALVGTGIGWASYRNITGGITTSQALAGEPASLGGDQNILIMGLDSRLDQHGQPLPQDILDALHAGDENAGGYNANVLIVLHVPAGGGQVTAISIPRDDYVDLAGCPTGVCQGKIKQAYGLAYQHALDSMDTGSSSTGGSGSGSSSTSKSHSVATATTAQEYSAAQEQHAREAGRKAEINSVRRLLGIPIDHFIEVTLVAFFQIARVLEPITVCLNEDTSDSYSGADFHKGVQQIDAAQALAFVRQRRDVNDELFTDMDRTRRQQAFIASLVSALRHGGALSSPSAMGNLLDVAKQNVAVDAGFDLPGFLRHASMLTDASLSLYTLPIAEFGQDTAGEDVNLIDAPTIRGIVHDLVGTGSPSASPSPTGRGPATSQATPTPSAPAVLDVVNASRYDGLAANLEKAFSDRGFTVGVATTADTISTTSAIAYGPGAREAAQTLADQLDLTADASDTIGPGTVQLTIGTDFPANDYLTHTSTTSTQRSQTSVTSPTPVTTVPATATGTQAPVPQDLTHMSANDTPCVK